MLKKGKPRARPPRALSDAVQISGADSVRDLPHDDGGGAYQWMGLDGEGIPVALTPPAPQVLQAVTSAKLDTSLEKRSS